MEGLLILEVSAAAADTMEAAWGVVRLVLPSLTFSSLATALATRGGSTLERLLFVK